MGKVICIANQKGGVGKTTTCVNLGIALAMAGKRVCLIDSDPQGSLTESLGYRNPDEMENTLADVLKAEMEPDDKLSGSDYDEEPVCDKLSRTIKKAILHHEEGVDLIPGNIELAGIEVLMVNLMSRELLLKTAIRKIRDEYDYIIIDCMPSLGMLTINALAASDAVIIPVQAAYLPAKGLEQFLMTVSKVRRQINRKLRIEGILLSMVDCRTNFAKEIIALIYETYGSHIKIFQTQIPLSVRAAESSAFGISIFSHDSKGKVAVAYRELTQEVMKDGR